MCGLGIVAIGLVAKLRAQAQKQLSGHGVVAVLVDVANDLREIGRVRACQQPGILGHLGDAILAEDFSTQLLPDGAYGTGGVGRVIQ